jgi:hypothetical protein
MSLSNRAFTFLTNILSSGIRVAASPRLLGRYTAGAGAAQEIKLGTGLTLTGDTLSADGSAPAVDDLTTSNGTASATVGSLGERITDNFGPLGALTTGDQVDLGSIVLTAGDWDVTAIALFSFSAADVTSWSAGLSLLSATLLADGEDMIRVTPLTSSTSTDGGCVPGRNYRVTEPTTIYLVAKSVFSAGTVFAGGKLSAIRVR